MAPTLQITDLSTHIQLTRSVVQAVGNVNLTIEAGEDPRPGRASPAAASR